MSEPVRFQNRNPPGASLNDVNLSGVTTDNANVEGLTIYGYDVDALLQAELAKAAGKG